MREGRDRAQAAQVELLNQQIGALRRQLGARGSAQRRGSKDKEQRRITDLGRG